MEFSKNKHNIEFNGTTNSGELWKYSKKKDIFYYRTYFQDGKNYHWLSKDNKTKKIINLRIQYLELILDDKRPQKDKNGLSFNHSIILIHCVNKKKRFFFHSDRTIIKNWYESLKKYCLLTKFNADYQIIQNIGHGNSSLIFQIKPRNHKNSKYYIAKIYDCKKISIKEILDEIKVNQDLKHPMIPEYYEVFLEENNFILIFEYINGLNLLDYLDIHGRLSEKQAALIIKNVLQALDYMHCRGYVHRNIKPKNIMICEDEGNLTAKIINFGLAKKPKEIGSSCVCGTPGFIAPEVLKRDPYDGKADIYGLGITLYGMLTGFFPIDENQKITKYEYIKKNALIYPNLIRDTLSLDVQNLIKRMTEYNASTRYTATDVLSSNWIIANSKMLFSYSKSSQIYSAKFKTLEKIEEVDTMCTSKLENKPTTDEKILRKYTNLSITPTNLALLPPTKNIFSFMDILEEKLESDYSEDDDNILTNEKIKAINLWNNEDYDETEIPNIDDYDGPIAQLKHINHLIFKTKPC